MITEDYNKGPSVVRKDYVLWNIQNMQVHLPGVAKHLVNFASLLLRHYLKFSECFWALLTVKYGRFFTLVLFGYRYEK